MRAKTMSEALLMADSDPTFKAEHGNGYLRPSIVRTGETVGCALGGIVTQLLPKKEVIGYAEKIFNDFSFDREHMIEKICGKIKGSCDQVPLKIWRKVMPDDNYAKYYENDEDEWDECMDETRWVDLVEKLYEQKEKSFKQIAKILKRYDK